MIYAKPATSLLVVFRAYLASDHTTPATGKTIAITISKNGGAFGNPNAGATNATEISSGFYKVTLDTTDTGTAGPLAVRGAEGTIDDVGAVFYVGQSPADVTHFGGTAATSSGGRPEVNLTHVAGSTTSVSALATGVATLLADWVNGGRLDLLIDAIKAVTDAIPNSGSMSSIATASALSTAQSDLTTLLARLTALRAGYLDNLSAGAAALQSTAAAIKAVTDLLPDAGALSSLATAANLATIAGYLDTEIAAILAAVDTEVAAIKAKTDNLPSDPADASDILSATNAIAAAIAALSIPTAAANASAVWAAAARTLTANTNFNDPTAATIAAAVVAETITELSAIPAASPTLKQALALLYMALRNKVDVTNGAKEIHTDAGTVLATKALSEDGVTYSEAKMA